MFSTALPGLIEGIQTPEMITKHTRNILQRMKYAVSEGSGAVDSRWDEVDVGPWGIVEDGYWTMKSRPVTVRRFNGWSRT